MNILYHHRTQGQGAEGVHIMGMVEALRKFGYKVVVVSPPGVDPLLKNTGSHGKETNRPSWVAKALKWVSKNTPEALFELFELMYNLIAYIKMARIIGKEKFDFIYERYAFFNWVGTYLARRYHIPIILEVNEVSGIKRMRGQKLVRLAKIIEKKIFNKANAIVVISSFLKKHIENMGVDSHKIYIIPNAVNIEKFNSDIWGGIEIRDRFKLNGKIVLGFVGWFSWWDNLEFLLNTFAEVLRKKANLHLMLIGKGVGCKELESKAIKIGINNNVTFTGRVNRQQIPNFIAAIDICIIPHSNPFGSPVVLFEYMAMGKPVVAPRLEPIEDVITNNVNGVLFEPGNKDSLIECILDLVHNEEKRKRFGVEGRGTILHGHLWEHNAEKIIQIYNGVKNKC